MVLATAMAPVVVAAAIAEELSVAGLVFGTYAFVVPILADTILPTQFQGAHEARWG